MNKQQCSASVYRDSYLWPLLCPNKASVERDEKFYCKRHDPVAVAEKRAARHAAYDAKWKAAKNVARDRQAAQDLLVRKAAAFDQIMAIWRGPTTWLFLDVLLQEFEEATHA